MHFPLTPCPIASPWELVSLRVKCADGLWTTGLSFDPEVLKMRGMVLASVEERNWKTYQRHC